MSKNHKKDLKLVRLQKYIADCGITSRRKAEDLIVQGRVQVNGVTVRELGTKVNPSSDAVLVDGAIADLNAVNHVYLLMNKPRCSMTTLSDPEGRSTVMDFCKEVAERVYPVGRLDYLSEGLLLLTNDGEMANMIMHPRYEVVKVYEVKVFGAINLSLLKKLRAGVEVDGEFLKPKSVRVIKQLPTKTWLEFRLGEGKNREIRKICEACGLTVDKLKRLAIGGITVEGIAPGKFTYVTKKQLLDGLGLNVDGSQKYGRPVEIMSGKRTVDIKKKSFISGTLADDKSFIKFRKETYNESLKKIEETKKNKRREEFEAKMKAKEDAHKARQRKKKLREKKKAERVGVGVHAQFVK